MLDPKVKAYLESHQPAILEQLKSLLRIPSIANVEGGMGGEPCRRAAAWLAEYLEGLGLRAEAAAVPDGPPCVLAFSDQRPDRPTLLLYGHYDVQPPDPLELWQTPPFEPDIREGRIYARGANDDKGQLFAHLAAVEAWQRAGGRLPVNLKLIVEGEEEVGSPHLEAFMTAHAARLSADAAVLSDSEFFAPDLPAITYALRGLVAVELTVEGPAADVHSGVHGGAVRNPINALAAIVAALHDERGRVTIPGFYDEVAPLEDAERRQWAKLPFDERQYARSLGLEELSGGEQGYSLLERRWARPTLDCNGIVGGYTGEGAKTIIAARADTKITMRLVPHQDPQRIIEGLRRFVADHTPPGIRASLTVQSSSRAVIVSRDSAAMRAAAAAYEEGFGRRPAMIRCGASVPVTEVLQRCLHLEAVLMGFGLPDDNLHSPNERFALSQLWGGAVTAASFMQHLAEQRQGEKV